MLREQIAEIQERLPPLFITICLESIIVLIYLLGMLFYPDKLLSQSQDMLNQWGQDNGRILNGEWYRLITAFWIHGNVIHLASNLLFLLIFGSRLEDLTNGSKTLIVFLASGICGNIATLGTIFLDLHFLSFGASGAVFGLLGAIIYLLRGKAKRERRAMYYFVGIFFMITISQDTNIFSHFFGLVGGFYTMKVLEMKG